MAVIACGLLFRLLVVAVFVGGFYLLFVVVLHGLQYSYNFRVCCVCVVVADCYVLEIQKTTNKSLLYLKYSWPPIVCALIIFGADSAG